MSGQEHLYSYHYTTRLGTVSIIPEQHGRFKVMIESENMGSYHSPQAAVDDVAGDHLGSTPWDENLDELGIPEDVSEWETRIYAKKTWG